jgi:hypothetical protein
MTKTFKLNENGRIEFTKEELNKLLDEVWNDGYYSNNNYVWESPYKWTPWWERPYYYDPITTTPYVTWASSPTTTSDTYTVSTQNSSSSGNSNCTSGDFVGDDGNNWTKTFGRTVDKVTPTNE